MKTKILACFIFFFACLRLLGQNNYKIVAYYSTDSASLFQYDYQKITHLIYGFAHVKEGEIVLTKSKDIPVLQGFQQLKKQYPHLKTMIALGGWGGCEPCSATFADSVLTKKFALSVKNFLQQYQLDGIDLDWEYPVVKGFPGHLHQQEDKKNFTRLLKILRANLTSDVLITFAAGGFQDYLEQSIEWEKIAPIVDWVNIMSYDLVHGYSTITGHHTNLYSTKQGEESVDNAIRFFENIQFPLKKILIGAAFYTRTWENVVATNNGLYKPGKFLSFIDYKDAQKIITKENGFVYYWDKKAQAPYWYNKMKKQYATADNKKSIALKCKYVKKKKLGGIMFWELPLDTPQNGLLEAVNL